MPCLAPKTALLTSPLAAVKRTTRRSSHRVVAAHGPDGGAMGPDLLVIGPGVLGGLIGKLWKDADPAATVVGQTITANGHERLRRLGLVPRLKQDAGQDKFSSVVFSAPPSGSTDYVGEVRSALQLWDGGGTFIFTSSSGVCKPDDGKPLSEDSPLHSEGTSERTDRLLLSERAVMDAGGCVVRFVGLYHAHRGAHTFFLRKGEVERWGGHVVNLIHYEDAAALCMKVLAGQSGKPYRSRLFFGTDSCPITFQGMMDATLASGAFEGSVSFTGGPEAEPGPASVNERTREALGWQPKYRSFGDFMAAGAKDFYSELSGS